MKVINKIVDKNLIALILRMHLKHNNGRTVYFKTMQFSEFTANLNDVYEVIDIFNDNLILDCSGIDYSLQKVVERDKFNGIVRITWAEFDTLYLYYCYNAISGRLSKHYPIMD